MAGMDAVLVWIDLGVVQRVYFGIVSKSNGECLYQNAHDCNLFITLFQQLSHFLHFSHIKLLVQVQMRDIIALSHRFLHPFLKPIHTDILS